MPTANTYSVDEKQYGSRAMAFAVAGEKALRSGQTVYVWPDEGPAVGYAEPLDEGGVVLVANGGDDA